MNATTPIWYTEKPKFKEVKGKRLRSIWMSDDGEPNIGEWNIDDRFSFNLMFEDDCVAYAIISEPEPEPVELWGVKPEITPYARFIRVSWSDINGKEELFIAVDKPTEKESILAWNKIATALQSIEIGGEE